MSNYNISNIPTSAISSIGIAEPKIRMDDGVNGSMQVNVPLVVNGRDILTELSELRDAVLLLKRNVDMEAKYPKLRELKDAYEAQLEKYKTFEALK